VRAVAEHPLTEDALVAAIVDALGVPARPLRVGIGDDAAAWQPNAHHLNLVTSDMLVDDVHFRSAATTAHDLGHKALAKNLSDIAAMGGRPVIAHIGPEASCLSLAVTRSEYGNRCVVCVDLRCRQNMLPDLIDQRRD